MDEHFRPRVVEIVGSGGLTALSLALVLAGAFATVLLWEEAGALGRVLLLALDAALALFAFIAGTYQWYDLAELRDRHRYNRERRMLLLERLEAALGADLDGDGVVGHVSNLPRIIPVRTACGVRLVDDDDGDDPALKRLESLIDAAGRVGLSRRRLLPQIGGDRALYDWALGSDDGRQIGVLTAMGLVAGRGARAEGRLIHDPETTKAILRRAWRAVTMSTSGGNGNGTGH